MMSRRVTFNTCISEEINILGEQKLFLSQSQMQRPILHFDVFVNSNDTQKSQVICIWWLFNETCIFSHDLSILIQQRTERLSVFSCLENMALLRRVHLCGMRAEYVRSPPLLRRGFLKTPILAVCTRVSTEQHASSPFLLMFIYW